MDECPKCLRALKGGHDFPLPYVAEGLRVFFGPPPATGGRMVTGARGDGRTGRLVFLQFHEERFLSVLRPGFLARRSFFWFLVARTGGPNTEKCSSMCLTVVGPWELPAKGRIAQLDESFVSSPIC